MKRLLVAAILASSAMSLPSLADTRDSRTYARSDWKADVDAEFVAIGKTIVAVANRSIEEGDPAIPASAALRRVAAFNDFENLPNLAIQDFLVAFTTPGSSNLVKRTDLAFYMGKSMGFEWPNGFGGFQDDSADDLFDWDMTYGFQGNDQDPMAGTIKARVHRVEQILTPHVTIYLMAKRLSSLIPANVTEPMWVTVREYKPTITFIESVRQFAAKNFTDDNEYNGDFHLQTHTEEIFNFTLRQMSPEAADWLANNPSTDGSFHPWFADDMFYDEGNTPQSIPSRVVELEAELKAWSYSQAR